MDGTPREKRPGGPGAGARPPAAAHPASQLFPVSSPSPPTPRLLRHHGRHHVRQDRLRPPRRRVRCVCVCGRDCAGGRARGGGGVELQGREKKSLTLSLLLVLSSQQQPPAAPPACPAPRPSSSGELGWGVMPVDPETWGLGSDPAARAGGGGTRGKGKAFSGGRRRRRARASALPPFERASPRPGAPARGVPARGRAHRRQAALARHPSSDLGPGVAWQPLAVPLPPPIWGRCWQRRRRARAAPFPLALGPTPHPPLLSLPLHSAEKRSVAEQLPVALTVAVGTAMASPLAAQVRPERGRGGRKTGGGVKKERAGGPGRERSGAARPSPPPKT